MNGIPFIPYYIILQDPRNRCCHNGARDKEIVETVALIIIVIMVFSAFAVIKRLLGLR